MDLVFKRYSNPYFLDLTIENNKLSQFIDMLLKKRDEEMAWEMYLATAMVNSKSFNEWKEELLKSDIKKNTIKMTKREIDAELEKAENILQNFKPPKEGGFYKC